MRRLNRTTSLSRHGSAAACAFALALCGTQHASAADCNDASRLSTCIDADPFWPQAGAGRLQFVGGTETTAPGQLGFGLVTTYLHQPIVLSGPSADPDGLHVSAIDDLVDATFVWSLGVTDRLDLSLAVPVALYQSGSGVSAFTSSTPAVAPKTAMRDLRFGLAYAIVPRPRVFPGSVWSLAARLEVAANTGDQDWFAGDKGGVWIPSLTADYRRGRWFAGAQLGARVRATTTLANARMGSQAEVALGLGFDILPQERLSATLEAIALPVLTQQQIIRRDPNTQQRIVSDDGDALIPAEWLLSVRTVPIPDGNMSFSLGAGTAIPLTGETAITSPDFRAVFGARFTPLARDTDGDGVPDSHDVCPASAEDIDGFEDSDGCPELDNDRDGIVDARDRCRDAAEDHDGYQDEDGCPDVDDDGDGVPDAQDACRFKPEDKDGFEDDDGCPELDNDGDGIEDSKDLCPNAAEDLDGYNDADGCPDPDNDVDKIPDEQDRCPMSPEDVDGFEDTDGCPDPDNDGDGVLDGRDRCPLQAETIDGVDDADGCPEPGARDLTQVQGTQVSVQQPVRFAAGQARVSPAMRKQLLMIAQRVMGMQPLAMILVQTYADRPASTEANEELAASRADAIRGVLLQAGVPSEVVTAAAGDLTMQRPATAPQYDITVQKKPQR